MDNFESDEESDNEIEIKSKKPKVTYSKVGRAMERKIEEVDVEESDFERQLRLEKEEKEKNLEKKTRKDPVDGTEYEFDPIVKGWFPKIPDEKFLQYQMNYVEKDNQSRKSGIDGMNNNLENKKLNENQYYLYYGKFYKIDPVNSKWIEASDPVYSYIDYMSGLSYEWNQSLNQWVKRESTVESNENKSASSNVASESKKCDSKSKAWFDVHDDRNTNVYVSGLPLDIKDEEFEQMMSKYGIIAKDIETNKLKVRLYREENGELKGDGRCCYLMPESVKLCLQLLDGMEYNGHKIHVEKAKFEMKGNFDPNKVVKKHKNKNKEKKILEKQRQRLLGWDERPEIQRQKYEKVVVIKGIFSPNDLINNCSAVEKLKNDLKTELEEYGIVHKIIIYERNPEGVATVSFKEVEDADECCDYLNNRVWRNGNIITCQTWDGKTKYDLEETEEDKKRRLEEWKSFLEDD